MVWERTRQLERLRQALREYFPAALAAFPDLTHRDALAVLAIAPDPHVAARLSRSKIKSALQRGGRKLRIEERAAEIQAALRAEHLTAAPRTTAAHAAVVSSLVVVIRTLETQLAVLARELDEGLREHPDAAILLS